MSRIRLNRNKAKFRGMLGIRARLVLFALIIVGPLMVERIRALETGRASQISLAIRDFANITRHSIDARREVMASIEAVLKSSGYMYRSVGKFDETCALMRASLHNDLPWIRNLAIADRNGHVRCSTHPRGELRTNLGDQPYFRKAIATGSMAVSDFHFSGYENRPTISAAYATPGGDVESAVIIAAVNVDWMSDIMNNLGDHPGVQAVLVDAAGTVVAVPSDQATLIGTTMENPGILHAIAAQVARTGKPSGTLSFKSMDGAALAVSFAGSPGSSAQLVVTIDEARVSAAANHEIRTAYLQLAVVCIFVLLGALAVAERLIMKPIRLLETMAKQFGRGDWSARVDRASLPTEFSPLARALYGMAAQLRGREIALRANNDQLTRIASIDVLSGLENRRGFQNRLDMEWTRARQSQQELALLMIDVDFFKLYNDTYGHPQGDICLARIGATLAEVGARTGGFGARYGGEEFCLLLPDTDSLRAMDVGEMIRAAIVELGTPHKASSLQRVSVSVGVATADPHLDGAPHDLIEAADSALYAAKRRGRDLVVGHHETRNPGSPVSMVF